MAALAHCGNLNGKFRVRMGRGFFTPRNYDSDDTIILTSLLSFNRCQVETMLRAASIIRAKQKENSVDSIESVLWQNTQLPDKKEVECNFDVSLYLHG
jgi:hypothetical protein